jgi:hypothetical protein
MRYVDTRRLIVGGAFNHVIIGGQRRLQGPDQVARYAYQVAPHTPRPRLSGFRQKMMLFSNDKLTYDTLQQEPLRRSEIKSPAYRY